MVKKMMKMIMISFFLLHFTTKWLIFASQYRGEGYKGQHKGEPIMVALITKSGNQYICVGKEIQWVSWGCNNLHFPCSILILHCLL